MPAGALRHAVMAWLVTRLVLVAVGLPAVQGKLAQLGLGPPPAFASTPSSPLLAMWVQWDAQWYLDIADRGYTAPLPADVPDIRPNFFPALPLAIRALAPLVGSAALAGVLIANAAFLVALVFLYAWTAQRFSAGAASRLVWLYAAFPTSFFFSAVYAESLMLAGLAVAWWSVAHRRQHLSGVGLAVAVLSRPTGLVGAVAIGTVAVIQSRRRGEPGFRHLWGLVTWPALALCAYLIGAWTVFGDPFATIHTQAVTRSALTWPWNPFVDAARNGLSWNSYFRPLVDGLVAVAAIVALPRVLTVVGWSEAFLAAMLIAVPLSTGLTSFSRLVLPAFPFFVLLALELKSYTFGLTVVLALAAQAFLFAWFASAQWVA